TAEPERDSAMRAELVDEPDAALGVAESHQRLAEKLHPHRRAIGLGQLPGVEGWYPVPSEKVAHDRAGTGLRQGVVLFLGDHRQLLVTEYGRRARAPSAPSA